MAAPEPDPGEQKVVGQKQRSEKGLSPKQIKIIPILKYRFFFEI